MTTSEPARDLPQIAVACPNCHAKPGDLCTSHSGTRPRRDNTHQARRAAWAEAATAAEEKDTPGCSQLPGAASTARAEILAVLLAAGYNEPAATELLARADREPRDPDPNPDFPETLAGGHALVVEYGDCVMHASCQCGKPLGTTTPDTSLDTFMPGWERHTATEVSG